MCHGCHPSANVIKLAITSTRSLAYKSRRKQRGRGRRGEESRTEGRHKTEKGEENGGGGT
jgi:hypothetical protein